MRHIMIALLTSICSICYAQGPRFQLYLTSPCDNIERLDTTYNIMVDGDTTSFNPQNGIVHLPRKGKYKVWFNEGPLIDSIFELPDTGLTIFRYKESKIGLYYCGAVDCPPFYATCGKAISGYAEDFYDNGVVKMRGTFRQGYAKDSLVTFYPNGIAQRRLVKTRKLVHIQEFDPTGHLIKEVHNQNKSFMSYRESRSVEYYPDGKVKLKESNIKHVAIIQEFYPSGKLKIKQTKKSRNEYYENGILQISYKWKRKDDDKYSFSIQKDEYSPDTQLIKCSIYEYWLSYKAPQPCLDISKSDWINSITTFKSNKKIVVAEYISTRTFLEEYPVQ